MLAVCITHNIVTGGVTAKEMTRNCRHINVAQSLLHVAQILVADFEMYRQYVYHMSYEIYGNADSIDCRP